MIEVSQNLYSVNVVNGLPGCILYVLFIGVQRLTYIPCGYIGSSIWVYRSARIYPPRVLGYIVIYPAENAWVYRPVLTVVLFTIFRPSNFLNCLTVNLYGEDTRIWLYDFSCKPIVTYLTIRNLNYFILQCVCCSLTLYNIVMKTASTMKTR